MTACLVRDVILKDGSTLRMKPPAAEDRTPLIQFFRALSAESIHNRFRAMPRADDHLVGRFLAGDGRDRLTLMGRLDGDVVALGTFDRLLEPRSAEVSFVVADPLQAHGVGTRLLEQLADIAGHAGIETFMAQVASTNSGMLSVFRDAGFEVERERDGDTIELRFPIAATAGYRLSVDRRDHEATRASLRPFFSPRSVAVIGASSRPGTVGNAVVANLLTAGFPGHVYPVNRSGDAVHGLAARTVGGLPAVDLAVVSVPAAAVLDVTERVMANGTRAVCVLSAGFAETGPDGARREEELLAVVRSHGGRLLGPNCLGIAVPGTGLNATFAGRTVAGGNVALSSQSGALGLAVLEYADWRGFGLNSFVSVGNKADVSTNDLLEFWEDDAGARLVMLYVESFGNPRKFSRISTRVARRKPILAIKGGTGRAGARAAFANCGVLRVATIEELVDVAGFLACQPAPRGDRVAVVSNAGGLGILCTDACESNGLQLAMFSTTTAERLRTVIAAEGSVTNPVDMLGSATSSAYREAISIVLSDDGVDAAIALFTPTSVSTADDVAEAITTAATGSDKPVAAVVVSGRGIPSCLKDPASSAHGFLYPESAARTVALAARRSRWLRRPVGVVMRPADLDPADARQVVEAALADGSEWLDASSMRQLLGCYGVPTVAQRIAASSTAAADAAQELGFPVVVKTARAGIHKADIGGVATDLRHEDAVIAAAERIGTPALVQPMVPGGIEVLCGLLQDAVFGPVLALAAGGTLAELAGPAAVRLAPITDVDAEELVQSGAIGRRLAGYRATGAYDTGALTNLLHRLSALADDQPEIAELDLNPVIVLPHGCVAVDARIRVAEPAARPSPRTW